MATLPLPFSGRWQLLFTLKEAAHRKVPELSTGEAPNLVFQACKEGVQTTIQVAWDAEGFISGLWADTSSLAYGGLHMGSLLFGAQSPGKPFKLTSLRTHEHFLGCVISEIQRKNRMVYYDMFMKQSIKCKDKVPVLPKVASRVWMKLPAKDNGQRAVLFAQREGPPPSHTSKSATPASRAREFPSKLHADSDK
ncbi:UNVERIFIED_CONTAM: hypothetical protein FKN15_012067 [Acipenser sinensis]